MIRWFWTPLLALVLLAADLPAQAQTIFSGPPYPATQTQVWVTSVNFNSANTDTAIPILLPAGYTRYAINAVRITNASGTLTTATAGVFTSTSGGGIAVANNQSISINNGADATPNNSTTLTIVNAGNITYTVAAYPVLYFRVGTPQGVAATGTVEIVLVLIP
jgi:hypothetical protein